MLWEPAVVEDHLRIEAAAHCEVLFTRLPVRANTEDGAWGGQGLRDGGEEIGSGGADPDARVSAGAPEAINEEARASRI